MCYIVFVLEGGPDSNPLEPCALPQCWEATLYKSRSNCTPGINFQTQSQRAFLVLKPRTASEQHPPLNLRKHRCCEPVVLNKRISTGIGIAPDELTPQPGGCNCFHTMENNLALSTDPSTSGSCAQLQNSARGRTCVRPCAPNASRLLSHSFSDRKSTRLNSSHRT